MSRLRALCGCAAVAAALALALPGQAGADVFGSISLLSASPLVQSEYARAPAISGDGRYIVFQGSIGGVTGIWRREILRGPNGETRGGSLVQVAGGDAELPSISENGQYVSFTTSEGAELEQISDELPDVNEHHEAPNVYVRDMEIAPQTPCSGGERCAFTLASAVSGPEDAPPQPLTYTYPAGPSREVEEENYGSAAVGRTAISADGSEVAFVTTAESDLAGAATPRLQVAVRNIDTNQTELVSVRIDPATGRPAIDPETGQVEPVQLQEDRGSHLGAVFTGSGEAPLYGTGVGFEATTEIGASISADGSTVAWAGQAVGEQVPTLSGEPLRGSYSAPLWRRIGEGEQAPTRLVAGGADPTAQGCIEHPEAALPEPPSEADPCQGPFRTGPGSEGIWTGGIGDEIPRLSADGQYVAFLATAPLVSLGNDFGQEPEHPADLYVANMQEGLTLDRSLRQLTELASPRNTVRATNAPISDLAISPDGTQVAFTTERTEFPLGSPAYVSTPAAQPGLSELYDVDLAQDTLTRVSKGYKEGELSEQPGANTSNVEDPYEAHKVTDGALCPSFSATGELLAFSSTASNLVFGDGNAPVGEEGGFDRDGSDAFVVNRITFPAAPTGQTITPAPPNPAPVPAWQLSASVESLASGAVRLNVEVPGSGTLQAQAEGRVAVRVSRARRARHGARRARAGSAAALVQTRTVASAAGRELEGEGGLQTLTLTLSPAYRSLASARGGLFSTVNLTFAAAGHPTLRQSIQVRFRRVSRKRSARASRRQRRTWSR
jgi:Tol biopolymer transport system component